MKNPWCLGTCLALTISLVLSLVPVLTPLPALASDWPCRYIGPVTLDGENVESNTPITAWIGGTQVTDPVLTGDGTGLEDYEYCLTIQLEYAPSPNEVAFKIGDLWANETYPWIQGGRITAPLSASTGGLQVIITAPEDEATFSTCQNFTVTATVTNTGDQMATGVTATVDPGATASRVSGDNPQPLGDIPADESRTAIWTLHCDQAGDSTITVTATNTGDPLPVSPDAITVHQETAAELVVEISAPADGATLSTCQGFTVTATVSNTGEATATGVSATVSPGATASVVSGANPQSLGDITGGSFATATWTLHCDSPGDSIVTVTAAGIDENKNEPVPMTPDSITVHQQIAAELIVEITSPSDGATFMPCNNFTVTATITNTGEATAVGVTATIDPGTTASVVEGQINPQPLGDIPGGQIVTVTWTLHCDEEGDSTITVTATGTDFNKEEEVYGSDTIVVRQVVALALVEGINIITYAGATCDLPAALTNIGPDGLNVVEIIWARGAWTSGEWLFYDAVYPGGSTLTQLENGQAYIIVVTEYCEWQLPT